MLAVKECDPHEVIADEKLLFKYISELVGRQVKFRQVPFLSTFR